MQAALGLSLTRRGPSCFDAGNVMPRSLTMSTSQLTELTAVEARDRMAKGDITAETYTQAWLDQITARDKDVEAWAWLDPAHALAQARQLDKQRAAGGGLGALHGLPV